MRLKKSLLAVSLALLSANITAAAQNSATATAVISSGCEISDTKGNRYFVLATQGQYRGLADVRITGAPNGAIMYWNAETQSYANQRTLSAIATQELYAALPDIDGSIPASQLSYEIRKAGILIPPGKSFKLNAYLGLSGKVSARINFYTNVIEGDFASMAKTDLDIRILHNGRVVSSAIFKGTDIVASASIIEKNWLAIVAAAKAQKCKPRDPYGSP